MANLPHRRRRRKSALPVNAEWVQRLGYEGRGIALIGRGDQLSPYQITENREGERLLGYRLEKCDGTAYDVDILADGGPTCECKGFLRWHAERGIECKHIVGLRLLVGLPPHESGLGQPNGQCFPDDFEPFERNAGDIPF